MADAQPTMFNFELVSPEKVLVSEPAWQVTIPGEEGYFGVRAGHMSLIAAVRAGVVEVVPRQGEAPKKIFISGGFADVTGTSCTLLAEQAMAVSDIDTAAVSAEISNLQEDLRLENDPLEKNLIQKKLSVANEKLAAVKAA